MKLLVPPDGDTFGTLFFPQELLDVGDQGYADPNDKPAAILQAVKNLESLKDIRRALRGSREEEAKAVQQWKKVRNRCLCEDRKSFRM